MHTISAEECEVHTINKDEARQFYAENSFVAFKEAYGIYGLKYNDELVLCMQSNIVGRCLSLCNICFKIGVDVMDALQKVIKHTLKSYDKVQIAIDRRLWPRSILDGVSYASITYTQPNKHFCIGKLKDSLVDELSENDAKSLHYTICDSGDIIVNI